MGRMSNMPITHFVHSPVACSHSCLHFYVSPSFSRQRYKNTVVFLNFFLCRLLLFCHQQRRCVYEVVAGSGFDPYKVVACQTI